MMLQQLVANTLWTHRTPVSLNYSWNTGSYVSILFVLQILSGFLVSLYYVPAIMEITPLLEILYRDVNGGFWYRYLHVCIASYIFLFMYIHMYKNMFYSSYLGPKANTWYVGVLLYFMTVTIAFLGYTLPFGQLSYWGGTVITNLVTAIPIVGQDIVLWLRGDYLIGGVTIPRFFVLHVILPFVTLSFVALHFYLMHKADSSDSKGASKQDKMTLYPYALIKDLAGLLVIAGLMIVSSHIFPNLFLNETNYFLANDMDTPEHIIPEWYLCHFYALVRSFDNKTVGVLIAFANFGLLLLLPMFHASLSDSKVSHYY